MKQTFSTLPNGAVVVARGATMTEFTIRYLTIRGLIIAARDAQTADDAKRIMRALYARLKIEGDKIRPDDKQAVVELLEDCAA